MTRTANIQIRVEPEVKQQAEQVCSRLGLSLSAAVNLFLNQVIMQQGLPFDVKVPQPQDGEGYKNVLKGRMRQAIDVTEGLRREYEE